MNEWNYLKEKLKCSNEFLKSDVDCTLEDIQINLFLNLSSNVLLETLKSFNFQKKDCLYL